MNPQKQYPRNWELEHKPSSKWQTALVTRKDPNCRDTKKKAKSLPDLSPTELYEVIDEGYHYFWNRRGRIPPNYSAVRWAKA
jgi:hypothetical protein